MTCALVFVLLSIVQLLSAVSSEASNFNCSSSIERQANYGVQFLKGDSTLTRIYESLINCPNTTALQLKLYDYGKFFEPNLLHFKFVAGDRFPPLQNIDLNGYDFGEYSPFREQASRDQGQTNMKPMLLENEEANYLPLSQHIYIPGANLDKWRAAMDWTALHTLKLINVDNVFFWKMKGHLPALKDLTVRDNQGRSNISEYIMDFITFLNPLSILSTHGYTGSINWSQLLDRHGNTLERLSIQEWNADKPEDARPTLSIAQLEEISRRCPRLGDFSVNVKMDPEISDELLDVLASFKNVTKFGIRVHGNKRIYDTEPTNQSYELSADSDLLDGGRKQGVKPFTDSQTILKIFQNLRRRKQGVELQHLEAYVGNMELRYDQAHFDWVEGYEFMPTKHVCSVLDEEGVGKMEGEAWCHCEGPYCGQSGWW